MGQEIRNYKITVQWNKSGELSDTVEDFIFKAFDLNEALTQFGIKFQDYYTAKVIEVIPFKYAEETKPVSEQKKEVHVKPLPDNLSLMGKFGFPNSKISVTKITEWIKVSDGLPSEYIECLIFGTKLNIGMPEDRQIYPGQYMPGIGFTNYSSDCEWGECEIYNITHYMPYPKSPDTD